MKVELNIDAKDLGDDVKDLLRTLSEEDKKALATKILEGHLAENKDRSSQEADKLAVEELNDLRKKEGRVDATLCLEFNRLTSTTYNNGPTEEERVKFEELKQKYMGLDHYFAKTYENAIKNYVFSEVGKRIEKSEVVKNFIEQAASRVEKQMPKMIEKMMALYFRDQLGQIFQNSAQITNTRNHLNDLDQKLLDFKLEGE